jgi:hypothetical protein
MTLVATQDALRSIGREAGTTELPLRLTITLYPPQDRGTTCHACGAECAVQYGLPVDDSGHYVENDYAGDWAGVPACRACYQAHANGGGVGLTIRLRALTEVAAEIRRDTQRGRNR